MAKTLETLREEIDRADAELIKLLEKRQALVHEAAQAKQDTGEAAYSKERESFMLEDRARLAKEHNLPDGLIEDVLKRLLRESYSQSGAGHYACTAGKNPRDVVIIGGNGGMGRIFRAYFEASGYKVFCFGHRGWDEAPNYLKNAGIVIVTVPIDITIDIIKKVSPLLRDDMVLCDFTSVKGPIVRAMLEYHKGPVLGLHPMFGPDVKSLVKQVIVTVPARGREASQYLVDQMALWGAKIVECDADEHDRSMSIIQALRHFTTYCYGTFLASLNPDLKQLLELSSPIYRMELMMVGRLFAQDPRLYADIIMSSEANLKLLTGYVESLKPELDCVLKLDMQTFTERFLKAREYFGEYSDIFLKDSGRLLAKMQDERH